MQGLNPKGEMVPYAVFTHKPGFVPEVTNSEVNSGLVDSGVTPLVFTHVFKPVFASGSEYTFVFTLQLVWHWFDTAFTPHVTYFLRQHTYPHYPVYILVRT